MSKKVLIVFAHPERNSLNGQFLDEIIDQLKTQGDKFKLSDLYGMGWKSEVDINDFPDYPKDKVFQPSYASKKYHQFTPDVIEEQNKLIWADTVLFVFPLWWYNLPAILKGWFDRVFSSTEYWKNKTVMGKNVSLIVTMGATAAENYDPHDPIKDVDQLLSNIFRTFYSGRMNPWTPLYFFGVAHVTSEDVKAMKAKVRDFIRNIPSSY
ncbi:FMN red super family [Kluyveromyces marxianus]|nr:FMN red super family [Kluyveromyces marxianus]